MRFRTPIAASLASLILFFEKPARAYDMDCAIMLCMAGGFPSSAVCAVAYAEMIRRITPWPSQTPFGICTFTGAPIALGGSGRETAIDISTPEYAWLHKTRVLWWRSHYSRSGGEESWSWSLRSCDPENRQCRYLSWNTGASIPWPKSFTTENGQIVIPPQDDQSVGFRRAVLVEYGDYAGNLGHSDWQSY